MQARKRFGYGQTVDYPATPNCIGFVRKGHENRPGCAVILSNREEGYVTKFLVAEEFEEAHYLPIRDRMLSRTNSLLPGLPHLCMNFV